MFCPKCGKEILDDAVICVHCGRQVNQAGTHSATHQGERRDWLTTLLLCIFLGGLGVHRFYTGHTGIGVAQLLTLGGCGIWTLIDLIMIVTNAYKDAQGQPLQKR